MNELVIEPLWPPLSEDALLLGQQVAASPHDFNLRMALADALRECGRESEADWHALKVMMDQYLEGLMTSMGLPADLFGCYANYRP